MELIPGKKTRLAVRAQHLLYISDQLTQPLKPVFDDSKKCLAHGHFSVRPGDGVKDNVFIMVCKTALLRCVKKVCVQAKIPAGFKPNRVRWSPHDPNRVVATGVKQAVWSGDGGKTFSLASGAPQYAKRIAFDPRKGTKNVYLLTGTSSKVYRSMDGGKSYPRRHAANQPQAARWHLRARSGRGGGRGRHRPGSSGSYKVGGALN